MLGRDFEDEVWTRFVFELVIWPNRLLWKDELNPRVRCAFGNVFHHLALNTTSSTSSVLVASLFLQSGMESSFFEFASSISLAVYLNLSALNVSPKISLRDNKFKVMTSLRRRTCPPCWWCWESQPAIAHKVFLAQAPHSSLRRSSKVEPWKIILISTLLFYSFATII